MAVDSVTAGYSFPAAGGDDVGGGLVDVSAAGTDATHATPEMQRQVQVRLAARLGCLMCGRLCRGGSPG